MNLVFDRTQKDAENAVKIIKEKVKNFQELTEEEIQILEKGTLTINTLNRIEAKQAELKTKFNEMGYWNTNIINKTDWGYGDIFDEENFRRILNNLDILKNAFFVYSTTPKTPEAVYQYKGINDIEKSLFDLETMIQDVKNNYRECGVFECGEQ